MSFVASPPLVLSRRLRETGDSVSTSRFHRVARLKAVVRTGVLVSGGGRSLENICQRLQTGQLRGIEIACVIASKRTAQALERAQKFGISCHVVRPKDYDRNSNEFSDAITTVLNESRVDLVVLAGFMHFYRIPDRYQYKVINIHPSLIPAFCGKGYFGHHVHQAAVRVKTSRIPHFMFQFTTAVKAFPRLCALATVFTLKICE